MVSLVKLKNNLFLIINWVILKYLYYLNYFRFENLRSFNNEVYKCWKEEGEMDLLNTHLSN